MVVKLNLWARYVGWQTRAPFGCGLLTGLAIGALGVPLGILLGAILGALL